MPYEPIVVPTARHVHGQRAYRLLHVGYTLLPILAGLDKFFHVLVDWDLYLAPAVMRLLPVNAEGVMQLVGGLEIAAGLLVALRPRLGGRVVALWLWGIIANLLLIPDFYDIALRDFGLSLGALALAQLSDERRRWSDRSRRHREPDDAVAPAWDAGRVRAGHG